MKRFEFNNLRRKVIDTMENCSRRLVAYCEGCLYERESCSHDLYKDQMLLLKLLNVEYERLAATDLSKKELTDDD